MIAMWTSVSRCCTQRPCPLRCVLCCCLVHMWWGFLEPWSTQDLWWGWTFVIPISSTISCNIFPLLQLTCRSIYANRIVVSAVVGTVVIVSSFVICISYTLILFSILHVPSSKGWSKALSTCLSHFTTVGLFYGFGLLTHVRPSSSGFVEEGTFSHSFPPMWYPCQTLSYNFRNKGGKIAVKKILKRITDWTKPLMPPFLCRLSFIPARIYPLPLVFFSHLPLSSLCLLDRISSLMSDVYSSLAHNVTLWAYLTGESSSALSDPIAFGE